MASAVLFLYTKCLNKYESIDIMDTYIFNLLYLNSSVLVI